MSTILFRVAAVLYGMGIVLALPSAVFFLPGLAVFFWAIKAEEAEDAEKKV